MTDITARNNIFYEARSYNATLEPITATQDLALIYPLLRDAGNYAVGVAKATIPLQAVPLRKNNIPLKTYQVGLKQGSFSGTAYVRQINSNTNNFFFSQNGLSINKYTYTSGGSTTVLGAFDVSPYMNYLYDFLVDDYLNYYCVGSNFNSSFGDTLYIISNTSVLIDTLQFTNINSIYINGTQTLFVADTTPAGGIVSVYSNLNSTGSVQLTLLATITEDFATDILQNIVFVVATLDTTIIGHDTNKLTFYNQQYEATTDYRIPNVVQMTASNVLNGNGTLIVADSNTPADAFYGIQGTNLYNADTYTQETFNVALNGNPAILATAPYAFYAGGDTFTYYTSWPITSPPVAPSLANNTTAISVISSNKNGLYGITSSNEFVCFNLDLVGNNVWFSFVNTQQINGNDIISMDWNASNDYIVAVDSNNDLYQSATAVYPINLGYLYNGSLSINGGSNNSFANSTINTHNLTTNAVNSCVGFAVDLDGSYYCIEGVAGSQVVNQRNQLNYSLPVIATYNFAETGFDMKLICIVGNYIVVCGSNNIIYIYTKGTNTLVKDIIFSSYDVVSICSLDDITKLAIGFNEISPNQLAFISVYDVLVAPPISTHLITSVANPVLLSITANKNDLSGTNSAVFYSINYGGTQTGRIEKLAYTATYQTPSTSLIIDGFTQSSFNNLTCNPTTGMLYYHQNIASLGLWQIFSVSQASGYNAFTTINNFPNGQFSQLVVSPNLNGVIGWNAITSNVQAKNVSISRNNVNVLNIIEKTSNTIYQGTMANNVVDFLQLGQYATQTYTGLGNVPNTLGIVDSTIRTYTISNQTLIAEQTLANQKINSIAKNEINLLGEFLVPTTNSTQITSYSFNLTQNYQIPLATTGALFAKNGEDIDAGAVDIFSYSVLIAAINLAFQEAYARLRTNNPTPLTEAPTISLDYATGLCTLTYSADYSNSTNNGILFNNALNQLITFNPYQASVSLPGLYRIILPLNSTSYTQTAKTIFQFNLLDKIGIQSNTIFVSDSYFGNNQTNRIISTIDVPTTDFLENIGQILYFQPTFIRPYTLSSSNAIDRIQIDVLYQYKDFTTYNLLLASGANWTVLLDFIKRF